MNLKPIGDNIVVKMTEVEETTKSGIILTNSAKEKPQIAEIHSNILNLVLQGCQSNGRLRPFPAGPGRRAACQQQDQGDHQADQFHNPTHKISSILRKGTAGGMVPSAVPGGFQCLYFSISCRIVQVCSFTWPDRRRKHSDTAQYTVRNRSLWPDSGNCSSCHP